MEILDWDGHRMEVARSRNGVLAACYHHHNLIQRASAVGEPAEIIQKLVRSRHSGDFDRKERERLYQGLGYYCDLQSLHSEDAITWSVMGNIAHCDEPVRVRWTRELFSMLGLKSPEPDHSEIALWRRVPHPEVLTDKGPEIDFSVITEDTVLLVECKWTAGIARNQGRNRDKDQIQLRMEFLQRYGRTITCHSKEARRLVKGILSGAIKSVPRPDPEFKNLAVLLLTPRQMPIEDKWLAEGVEVRATTWQDVCSMKSHPWADEVLSYYKWKHDHTRWEVPNN